MLESKRSARPRTKATRWYMQVALVLIFGALVHAHADAQQVTLIVEGPDGEAINGYRWQLEEDATYEVVPGQWEAEPLSLQSHRSYIPIVSKGVAVGNTVLDVDPQKRYYVSVLPNQGYALGGAQIRPGDTSVTVTVNKFPIPTAQITLFAFEDTNPINNTWQPGEPGLEGFKVILEDAGGRYGASGGQLFLDAYGNPLGTTYNPDGTVKDLGTGVVFTGPDGTATIQNLPPAKYGVQIVPPEGQGWSQTTTIEGSRVIDTWVRAGEPPYLIEFNPPFYHVFMGFVQNFVDGNALNGTNNISGRITNLHLGRPPQFSFDQSEPFGHTFPYVGLNDIGAGGGTGIYAQPANQDGTFLIEDVPPGNYQLVVWDEYLDFIISFRTVIVSEGDGNVDLGDVPVFTWFTRLENWVFNDVNENGFRDPGEGGIPEVGVNLRFRDGTIYQAFPTDVDGFVPFDEVFPFFHFLVAEVDFAFLKATGATITVDAGGSVDNNDPWSWGGQLNPQPQPDNGDLPYRTETGMVLTEAYQGHLGQTSVIEWGKTLYGPGENGGISGIVFYAVTRAEDDPRYAAAEEWEPGIPNVVVNLYEDNNLDKVIDDLDGDGGPTLADVDNHPFGNFPSPEDIDRNSNGQFDFGDAIQITATDSWDDNVPSNCPGDQNDPLYLNGKGYDGMRTWNQIRPGVFDGGYAFTSYFPGGMGSGSGEVEVLPSGMYIVEAVAPKGPTGEVTYEIMKEEDKNVDFGEDYEPPTFNTLPPPCVGDLHLVPAELTLFPGIPAPFAGEWRPLADRKQISVLPAKNAAVDFFMHTEVPVAAHFIGFCSSDTNNEHDPNAPFFGEKFAPPWLPIAIRDFTGREVYRTYSDQWGKYNGVVYSTFTANLAAPSGMGPAMFQVSLNDPGPIPDPNNPGSEIIDPYFNPQYSQTRLNFQFMPGTTTYLDTPVIPVAAFTGTNQFPLDCEFIDGTPKIYSVAGPQGGAYAPAVGDQLTITSEGDVQVANPFYDGPNGVEPKLITRDYGFGAERGIVAIGGVPLQNVSWTNSTITGTVAPNTKTGQLMVIRGDNDKSTITGVTVTVGPFAGNVHHVLAGPGTPIQDAIDAAAPGDLILVEPGVYNELVVMWKPVLLQGSGPASTVISALKAGSNVLDLWRAKVQEVIDMGKVDLLPGQDAFVGVEPGGGLFNEEGPGVTVLAKNKPAAQGGFGLVNGQPNARIDGFVITGADNGGAILVNGYARHLQIGNNRIANNAGFWQGGIRSGQPFLTFDPGDAPEYVSCQNSHLRIHHNHIAVNGGKGGFGGGVSLLHGTDFYEVSSNHICGNFTQGEGAGIGHYGLSRDGVIENNVIYFNQSFNQGRTVNGGGLFIGGGDPLDGADDLSPGSGSVKVLSNIFQGNQAGAGDGGGIRLHRINGHDVAAFPDGGNWNGSNGKVRDLSGSKRQLGGGGGMIGAFGAGPGKEPVVDFVRWYKIEIYNNMIVNNITALAGGGISLQDAARVQIVNNTIVNNDSTATAAEAFPPGSPEQSEFQPAGIVSRPHSTALADAFGNDPKVDPFRTFSNPTLFNNVIWHNRSFFILLDDNVNPPELRFVPDIGAGDPEVYWDLEVLGLADKLDPRHSVLSDVTGFHPSNLSADPKFVAEYFNVDRAQSQYPTSFIAFGAFDEGGNWLEVVFGPLTRTDAAGQLLGDYHIQAGSPAVNQGNLGILGLSADLKADFDGDPRPSNGGVDIGADETTAPQP